MSDFRATAHLQEQLGEARWQALIDPANTGKVQAFCNTLVEAALPTEMTIGGVAYDILPILKGKETSVVGHTMVERAKEMGAHQGKTEREHVLKHEAEIPVELRGKVAFVFTDDRRPGSPGSVYCVYWADGRWVKCWYWFGSGWDGDCRVLRRKSA